MIDPLLTSAARRHITQFLKAVTPYAGPLNRRFRFLLRSRGHDALRSRALLAITAAAASALSTLAQFLEQVEYNGRRLAKLNVEPEEAKAALRAFGALLDERFAGQYEPAREQLYLATELALHNAFYSVRESEAQAFFGLYRAEADASDLDDLLRRFVRILTRTFRAQSGRLLLLDRPLAGGAARPFYVERGGARERFIVDPEMRGRYSSYWSFPMAEAAVLQLAFAVPYPWLPREATLLQAAAERCSQAIQKAQLQADVRRLEAEAHCAEEEERRRIGRELHDEVGQSLLVLRLQLETMERQAGGAIRPMLAGARALTERTVDELRRIVAALSPAVLERLGLEAAVRQLAARFRKMHAAHIRVQISGRPEGLSRQSEEVVYRVAQESLQNIAKHSQGTRVNLLLHSTDKRIRLSVSDNGAGFDTASSKPMSFGLAGMKERAALLQGKLAIRSAPEKGVRVVLELPRSSLR